MRFLIFIALLFSCAEKPKATANPYDVLKSRRDFYVSQLSDDVYKHRCDKLTFRGLTSAFGKREAIEEHEVEPGKFRRDVLPCFPHDSRSSISLDGYLGVLHHAITYEDWDMVIRIQDYANRHHYIMGEGPIEYTNIIALRSVLNVLSGNASLDMPKDISEGYKGHIAANLIFLRARAFGRMSAAELFTLKRLHELSPGNPFYAALYHRYHDGDQEEAISILTSDFADEFPIGEHLYGWGSAPDSVFFILVMGVLDGK